MIDCDIYHRTAISILLSSSFNTEIMEFKKLEIKQDGSWIKRFISSKHTQKTGLYMLIGAVISFLFYYFTEGINLTTFHTYEALKSIFIGAFFGLFITNSPCARGKC